MSSETPRYEINLTHGDMHISLESDDVYFISKQMNGWLKIFLDDSYVPVTVPERAPQPAPKPASKPAPAPEPVYEAPPAPQPVRPTPVVEEERHVPKHHAVEDDYAPPLPKPQKPPHKHQGVSLPGETEIPEYQPAPPPRQPEAVREPIVEHIEEIEEEVAVEEVVISRLAEDLGDDDELSAEAAAEPKDDFEMVMDSLMKDLDDDVDDIRPTPFTKPAGKPIPAQRPVPTPRAAKKPAMDNGYEQVKLPVSVMDDEEETSPALQPAAQLPIDSLSDLCDRANAATSEDYLILTAYYLDQFEGVEKFSLKRVNSMLVKSGLTPVNHSVLESALSNQYLTMVPDLTGTADVSEYTLSEQGKSYAGSLF